MTMYLSRMIVIGAITAMLPLSAATFAGAQEGTPRQGAAPQVVAPSGAPRVAQRSYHGGRGWHGGEYGSRHRRHGWGSAAGFGAGFLLGSAFARPGPYAYTYEVEPEYEVAPVYRDSDEIAYCSRRFRSYDAASGTYLGFDGERHPCP